MRLVIANPHIQPFSHTVASKVLRRRSIDKYKYFIDEYIKNDKRNVAFYIDGTRSSFNTIGIRFTYYPKLLSYLELLTWMLIHSLNPFRYKVYFNITKLNPQEDIIFNFSNSTIDGQQVPLSKLDFHKFKGIVATHLTHYFIGTKSISSYLNQIEHNLLLAENNLAKNEFFRTYFPHIPNVYTLPFVLKPRYRKNDQPFSKRLNKCFAVGTLFEANSPEYKEFFKETPFHPMRQHIFEQQQSLTKEIDSYITSLDKSFDIKQVSPNDSWYIKLIKRTLPYFLLENMLPNHKNQYFSFDIVAKYNEYRMFISPEEIIGLPSINAIEGMACGAALLAIDDPMYTDLGLIPNVHYISYQANDLNDLLSKIRHYQDHPDELEGIAQRGYEFVTHNYTAEKVASLFWKDLESILEIFISTQTVPVNSSFKAKTAVDA